MESTKLESLFLAEISKAISIAAGPKLVAGDSYLKRDLGLSSIELLDFWFELERSLKREIGFRQLLLAQQSAGNPPGDIKVRAILDYLLKVQA